MTSRQETPSRSEVCSFPRSTRGTEQLTNLARDAFFVSVGFGVLAFQRTQVHRRELAEALTGSPDSSLGRLEDVVKLVEHAVAATTREVRRLVATDAA